MSDQRIRLYKFTTTDTAKNILLSQSLRFTPLLDYNDPFEGENVFRTISKSGQVVAVGADGVTRLLEHSPNMRAVAAARKCISQHSACCFSARYDSTLLWSHYADQHRGICLAFKFGTFPHNGKLGDFESIEADQPLLFREVNYSTQRPNLLMNTDDQSIVPIEVIDQCVFTKSSDWSYEAEWRFLKRSSANVTDQKFRKNILKQIIFGMRCSKEDVLRLSQIVVEKYGDAVTLHMAKKHGHKYAIEITPLSSTTVSA